MNSIYYGEILWVGGALGAAAGLVRGFVGRVGWAGERLGWVGLVRGFVGSWVALGFVWVSFPRETSEGFSFSRLTAGVELHSAPVEDNPSTLVFGAIALHLGPSTLVFCARIVAGTAPVSRRRIELQE